MSHDRNTENMNKLTSSLPQFIVDNQRNHVSEFLRIAVLTNQLVNSKNTLRYLSTKGECNDMSADYTVSDELYEKILQDNRFLTLGRIRYLTKQLWEQHKIFLMYGGMTSSMHFSEKIDKILETNNDCAGVIGWYVGNTEDISFELYHGKYCLITGGDVSKTLLYAFPFEVSDISEQEDIILGYVSFPSIPENAPLIAL